jgi:hypothetical protein
MRRIGQGSVGAASSRERRNADLFFADLMGRGGFAPGESVPQVGRRPRNADLFWSDLMGVRPRLPAVRAPLAPSPIEAPEVAEDTPPLKVEPTENPDEIVVTRADGARIHVRRKMHATTLHEPERPRIGLCKDDNRVFIRATWCRGTRVTIDLGANPQGAVKQLMDKVSDQINQGQSVDHIIQTFENAPVEPFLHLDVIKRDDWKVTGDIKLEVNRTGIISKTAKLSGDLGWMAVGVEYKDDGSGKQILATVDVPLSRRKIRDKPCEPVGLLAGWEAECWREVPTKVTVTSPGTIERRERVYLYFEYASTNLRRDPGAGATTPADEVNQILRSDPKVGTAKLNKRSLQRLDYLIGQGFWVESMLGYASPEGRRGPPGSGAVGADKEFPGNDKLSTLRAEKVKNLVLRRYVQESTLRMRDLPRKMQVPAGEKSLVWEGKSEQPVLDDPAGGELEGPKLWRQLIVGDANCRPFLEANPKELARMTAEDQKVVTDSSVPVRQRTRVLYQNLRRVALCLRQKEAVKGKDVPSFWLDHMSECPDDVLAAAEGHWGVRVPRPNPDPPIC